MHQNDVQNPNISRRNYLDDDEYGASHVCEVTINGYSYGINIDYVPEDKRDWFLKFFGDILTRVDAKARQEVRDDHEKRLRNLCGL